jgi:predicted porin
MKKSVLALAVLGTFAGVASAQGSVTLFGIVDLNVRSVSNNERTYSMGQDGLASSRLGFRSVEDLGGGAAAVAAGTGFRAAAASAARAGRGRCAGVRSARSAA